MDVAGAQARPLVEPRFPFARGGYESVYLRAVDRDRRRGLWLRHTVHQAPGQDPVGSVWAVAFGDGAPRAQKVSDRVSAGWIRVGDVSAIGPDGVTGDIATLEWEPARGEPLRHLPRAWMYRAPLPRTKPESPLPSLRLSGSALGLELDGWPGMLGHNWGSQHAERWIWLNGHCFDEAPGAWLDVVVGRVKVGPLLTPWTAFGALEVDGERRRVNGRARVNENPLGARVEVAGITVDVRSPPEDVVVWRYSDPDGSEHHTANGSVAELTVAADGRRLHTPHGGVYELGMRETTHGLPVLPFPDP